MFYVRAKRLLECRVQLVDTRLERASLFPFFERSGVVRKVMLVDWTRSELRAFDWTDTACRTALLRAFVSLDADLDDLALLEDDEAAALGELWHFDPWWVLAEPPFADRSVTPVLKATNCAHLLDDDVQLTFSLDLGRVTWIMKGEGDGTTARPWREGALPYDRPVQEEAWTQPGRTEWVLDPFWLR